MSLETLYHVLPARAILLLDGLLVSGEGPYLSMYSVLSGELLVSRKVLPHGSVQGFVTIEMRHTEAEDITLCVFGSKLFTLVNLNTTAYSIDMRGDVTELDDHIWEVACLTEPTVTSCNTLLACVLAHNSVSCIDLQTRQLLKEVHCVEKCILYCARTLGSTWADLVIAAGTVFNEVVLWTPSSVTSHGASDRAPVLNRLVGHEGVIFSIAFSASRDTICTASDDRSIRIWTATDLDTRPNHPNAANDLHPCTSVFTQRPFKLCKTVYGHTARVWDLRLLQDCIDAMCCLWSYDGDVIKKFKAHKGRSVWSMAVNRAETLLATGGGDTGIRLWSLPKLRSCDDVTGRTRVYQPCSDMKDEPRSVGFLFPRSPIVMTNKGSLLCLTDPPPSTSSPAAANHRPLFHSARYRSYTVIACHPHLPFVALGNIHGEVTLLCCDDVTSAGAMTSQHRQRLYDGKVFSLLWLVNVTSASGGGDDGDSASSRQLLLSTGPDGVVDIWQMDPALTAVSGGELSGGREVNAHTVATALRRVHSVVLPACKQRWVTSAVCVQPDSITSRQQRQSERLLVCGDRGGSLHVYDLTSQVRQLHVYDLTSQDQAPVQSLWKIHGKNGVSDVIMHAGRVVSSGRDGHYRVYSVEGRSLHMLSANRVLKGFEWLAKMQVVNGDLLVMGFYNESFLVYNTATDEQVLSVSCGGGHRSWHLQLSDNQRTSQSTCQGTEKSTCSFVYIKSRAVVVTSDASLSNCQTIVKPSLHGREICDVKHVFSEHNEHLLVTAGEDTMIKLASVTAPSTATSDTSAVTDGVSSGDGGVASHRIMATLQGHLSTVKAVCLSPESNAARAGDSNKTRTTSEVNAGDDGASMSYLLFSAGGRAELKAWRVLRRERHQAAVHDVTDDVPARGAYDVWFEWLADHSLTSSSAQSDGKKPWKHKQLNLDPETRYLDLSCCPVFASSTGSTCCCGDDVAAWGVCAHCTRCEMTSLHCVVCACSDGQMRIFLFDAASRRFHIIAHSEFHQHCVFKVQHFDLTIQQGNLSATNTNAKQQSCHQSGFDSSTLVLSSASDGKIALWDISELLAFYAATDDVSALCANGGSSACLDEPLLVLQHHQSGINSLDILQLLDGDVGGDGDSCDVGGDVSSWREHELLVASGGDDNALTVSHIRRRCRRHANNVVNDAVTASSSSWTLVAHGTVVNAHAAQITGLKLLNAHTMVTSSIDQRLNVWSLQRSSSSAPSSTSLQLRLCLSRFVHVADISNMAVWQCSSGEANERCYVIAIVGIGLQLLRLTLPE